jgi:DNA-binding MarR family transcriptional regulator
MPDPATLSDEVFHQLLALMRLHRQYARRIIAAQNIKPRDISVLRFISENESVKVSQVQHYIHNSPSTASALIAGMEKAGYLSRTRSPEDRRVVLVTLTPAGRALLQTTPLGGMPLLRRELQALPQERLREMAGVLAEIHTLMLGEEAP